MLEISHRMVVEQHGGDIRHAAQPSDIRFQGRLPMDGSIDREAPRKVLRTLEARK